VAIEVRIVDALGEGGMLTEWKEPLLGWMYCLSPHSTPAELYIWDYSILARDLLNRIREHSKGTRCVHDSGRALQLGKG
jgi:hypothetical protein